jgi:iron complex transport system substrate-binding protein
MKYRVNVFIWVMACLFVNSCLFPADKTKIKVVSLAPYVTEAIYQLGMQDCLLGCTEYCIRPAAAKQKQRVANAMNVNVEQIVQMKPDWVLASDLVNKRDIHKLRQLGLQVEQFDYIKSYADVADLFLKVALLLGETKKAVQMLEEINQQIDRIRKKTAGCLKKKVFVQIGANPLYTITKHSFINDYIDFAGGINIAENSNSGLYSREMVVRADPDAILIVTMGILAEKEKINWQRFTSLKAAADHAIHIFDSYRFCSPTPITFLDVLKEVARILHPDISLD